MGSGSSATGASRASTSRSRPLASSRPVAPNQSSVPISASRRFSRVTSDRTFAPGLGEGSKDCAELDHERRIVLVARGTEPVLDRFVVEPVDEPRLHHRGFPAGVADSRARSRERLPALVADR